MNVNWRDFIASAGFFFVTCTLKWLWIYFFSYFLFFPSDDTDRSGCVSLNVDVNLLHHRATNGWLKKKKVEQAKGNQELRPNTGEALCFCSAEEETVPRLMLLAELQRKLPLLTAASVRRCIEICGGYMVKGGKSRADLLIGCKAANNIDANGVWLCD